MSLNLLPTTWQSALVLAVAGVIHAGARTLHALTSRPVPFSDLYNVYHCFMGDQHLEFYRIHQEYGDVVRYGPNRVSFNTATALHAIYSPKANVAKSSHFRVFTKFFPTWSMQTIIDTQAFHHRLKRKSADSVHVCVRTHWSTPRNCSRTDIARLAAYLSFDVMGKICFGHSFEVLDKTEQHYILDIVSDGARCLNTVGHMQPLLHIDIDKLLFKKQLAELKRYKEFSALQCRNRMAIGPQPGKADVFNHLLEARHPESGRPLFTDQELACESSLLIIAGSDTSLTCISATLFYLLHNPEALQRAQHEIRGTFGSVGDVRDGPQLNLCRFLRAASTSRSAFRCPWAG